MLAQAIGDVVAAQAVFALRRCAARATDEAAQRRIRQPIVGQRDDCEPIDADELGADDERERQLLRCRVRSHDSGHGAFVGQREARVAELGGGCYELLRMRSPAQERKVAEAVKLGVNAAVSGLHDCPLSAE